LKQQCDYQLAAADQKHGAVYKDVFKSLGFIVGKTKTKLKAVDGGLRIRKRILSKEASPASMLLPPIIDTRALADEIISGRYPSMTRYTNDDFCRNAEHLSCLRERYTVKVPELEDFCVCHKCISSVTAKRLEKQQREDERHRKGILEESRLNPGVQSGKEYPYIADKARDVNELIESWWQQLRG
jgi:hypothetical protein